MYISTMFAIVPSSLTRIFIGTWTVPLLEQPILTLLGLIRSLAPLRGALVPSRKLLLFTAPTKTCLLEFSRMNICGKAEAIPHQVEIYSLSMEATQVSSSAITFLEKEEFWEVLFNFKA